ncbi:serine protease [Streptomyces platensis]|uniref:Periplasmic serine endoprotease DegP n=1 Tax=Streptomyces platensis TaxID=58346 RepID=A0AAE6NJ46_STRPT|nr:trypsin-like peptidase domain-containing protein [Streptomyces platensis]OSY36903.1 Periplasmic serine endoprotease DegP precursor [Streptomyces platensis]QEV54084.1 serine protease [Streptomyces platensis]
MTQSYRRSGDEMPQHRPYAYGDDEQSHGRNDGHGQDHGQDHGQGYGHGHEAYAGSPGASYAGLGGQAVPPPPPYAPEPRRRARRPVALIAAVALASGLIGGGSAALIAGATNSSTQNTSSTPLVNAGKTSGSGVSGVAKAVSPAIVEIKARTAGGESTGSGVVVTSSGEVVTNNHVVAGADSVTVTFSDGSRKTAKVVGTDPDKDLALVKVRGAKDLTAASLGDSSKITVGDQVVAIGSPEGLTGSVTSGIVSALDRDVTVPKEDGQGQGQGQQGGPGGGWPFEFGGNQYNGDTGSSKTSYKAIQTDASLNPGNSGGALINMQGQIIGINSAMYSPSSASSSSAGSVGLGFAIPINTVKDDLDALRGGGSSGV